MIFIDTVAFLARYVVQDQYFKQAASVWKQIEKDKTLCITSNFVIDETLTLLGRKAGYAFAAEKGAIIYATSRFEILRPTEEDEKAGLDFFRKYADQSISFTDCISFVLMKKRKISRIFSFDHHFHLAGFQLWPQQPTKAL